MNVSEVKRYYLWVEKYGGSHEMLEHEGETLPSQDLDAGGEYLGFNHAPLYVLASDYELMGALKRTADGIADELRIDLAALREELAQTKDVLATANRTLGEFADDSQIYQQRLTAAEQRNATLLETAQGLTIQLHAAIGNTEHHEDCIRDLAELQPTESGASE